MAKRTTTMTSSPTTAPLTGPETAPSSEFAQASVLVVEDDSDFRLVLERMLELLGELLSNVVERAFDQAARSPSRC